MAIRDTIREGHDLVTLGEALLRLSIPSPGRFETTRQLDAQIGGAEANVAATVARLGLRTAWISALPINAWGDRVRRELTAHGVDCAYVRAVPDARMGLYFLEYGAAPRPIRVLYDRRDSAFARLSAGDIDWEPVRRARLVHLSGITPALGEQARLIFRRALDAAAVVSFDVNYRAALWSPAEARVFLDEVVPRVRYLFIGDEEARLIFELAGRPEENLEALAKLAPQATIAFLQGASGSLVRDGGRIYTPGRRHEVQVIDPIGAGDAYVAGFLWATLRKRSVQEAVDAANAVAALKCSLWGDIAPITARDVEDVLAGGSSIRR